MTDEALGGWETLLHAPEIKPHNALVVYWHEDAPGPQTRRADEKPNLGNKMGKREKFELSLSSQARALELLRQANTRMSSNDVAMALNIGRGAASRYLERLALSGRVAKSTERESYLIDGARKKLYSWWAVLK